MAVSGVVSIIRDVNWYQYRPTSWVIDDLENGTNPISVRAWTELSRREAAGTLSAMQLDQMTELALVQQSKPVPTGLAIPMIDFLGRRYKAGRMSEVQRQRFMDQAVQVTVRVRPRVVEGDGVRYSIQRSARAPTGWWVQEGDGSTTSLDQRVLFRSGGGGNFMSGIGAGGGAFGVAQVRGLGTHEVAFDLVHDFFEGPVGNRNQSTRLFTTKQQEVLRFEVVIPTSADQIRLIRDPSLAAAIQASLTPKDWAYRPTGNLDRLSGVIDVKNLPTDVAFEVLARFNGKEHPLGRLYYARGTTNAQMRLGQDRLDDPAVPTTIDLILRSSERAARETVDMIEIWEGELIYRDVPVRIISPTTQP